jgi:hypothetical protein
MGREIRRVPPNWKHPTKENGCYQPMYDRTFAEAASDWKDGFAAWERGDRPPYCSEEDKGLEYWEYEGAPPENRELYRPYTDAEATWFQVYETVSEGKPVTPPFETLDALAAYLAAMGTYRDRNGWGQERADAFVRTGWVPSLLVVDGVFHEPKDIALTLEKRRGER